MPVDQRFRRSAPSGFTLIELLLVLVIVAALSGMLLPILPDILSRTHASTTAGSIRESANAIQLYQQQRLVHPDRWDSLISSNGGSFETLHPDRFTVVDLGGSALGIEGRIRSALGAAGITRSFEFANGIQGNGRPEGHPSRPSGGQRINTFDPYSGGIFDLTDDGRVVILGPAPDEFERLGLVDPALDPDVEAYVVLGLGARSTMIGRSMQAAPVCFPGQGQLDPTLAYARVVAVYAIPAMGAARLAATAGVHGDRLDSSAGLLEEFWGTTR